MGFNSAFKGLNYRYVLHGNKDTPHHSFYKIKLIKKVEKYFSKGGNFYNLTYVFCNIASCRLLNIHRRFGGASPLYTHSSSSINIFFICLQLTHWGRNLLRNVRVYIPIDTSAYCS